MTGRERMLTWGPFSAANIALLIRLASSPSMTWSCHEEFFSNGR
jgi:hypothetical protein